MLRPRIVHALLAATAAAIVLHAAISGCDHDEVEHLHAAWLVSQGQRPFVDFLEQHHPAIWYLLAPLARALEERPRAFAFAARCLDLGLIGLTIAAFTAMARRLLRDRSAAWPPLLLAGCFLFLRESMEVRPDPWMAALAAVALWQWTGFLRGGGLASAALAGLALGGSIVFLQKAIAFAALLALGTVFVVGRDFFRTLKGGAVLTLCAAVPVAILALQARPAFREFWFWNYTFNRYYYLQTTFPRPSAWETLGKAVFEDPLLWIGGIAGLGVALRHRLRCQPEVALAAVVGSGLVALLLRSRWPYSHNLILVEPCLALLAVRPVEKALLSPRLRRVVVPFFAVLFVKVCVMTFVYDENPGAARVQQAILESTARGDPVAVPPPFHPIFRRDSFFFWYVPGYNVAAYLDCCRERGCPRGRAGRDERAWTSDAPRFVYVPSQHPSWVASGFLERRADYHLVGSGLWERMIWPRR